MEKKLNRNMQDKMIGGVAGGLADYLDIDVTIVRVLLVLAVIFHGAGLLIYVVLWVAIPAGPEYPSYPQPGGGQPGAAGTPPPGPAYTGPSARAAGPSWDPQQGQTGQPSFQHASQTPPHHPRSSNRSGLIGWILVGLGVFFLADDILPEWFNDFYYWFNFSRLWPLIFVVVGAMIISSAAKKAPAGNPPEDPGISPEDPGTPPETRTEQPETGGSSAGEDENLNPKP